MTFTKAQNLFNLADRYTQGEEPTHVESKGRGFSIGLSYSY